VTASYTAGFYRVFSIHQLRTCRWRDSRRRSSLLSRDPVGCNLLPSGRERIQTFDPDRELGEIQTSVLFQQWELLGVEI